MSPPGRRTCGSRCDVASSPRRPPALSVTTGAPRASAASTADSTSAVSPEYEDRDVELREARGRDQIGAARRAPHPGDDDQRGAQARSGRLTAKRECLTTLGREGGQDLRHTVGIALLDGAGVVEVHSRSSVMEATSSRVSPAWSPTGQTTRSAVPW